MTETETENMNLRFADWLTGLTGGVRVAVLRRREHATAAETSGDWDLAVADAADFGLRLEENFGLPDLRIRRQYVEQWFYEWNQVDLLPVFEWDGVEYLDSRRFWEGVSRCADGLPRPRLAHDAFIAWMTGVLWGARFNERYSGLILSAWNEDQGEFRHCLRAAFGNGWTEELEQWLENGVPGEAAKHAGGLRRALLGRALRRSPGECLWRQFNHWRVELGHHLHPPYPWIALLGPDGSGKSSVIDGLRHHLSMRRLGMRMIHWSPRVLRKGQAVPGGIVPDPHSKPPRNPVMSVIKLGLIGAEWWWAWIWNIRHPRAKAQLLLSDRYYDDLLVDPRRYRFGAPVSWAKAWFQWLPKPDHVIVLAGDAEAILARKKEVTPDELERQLAGYRKLAAGMGARATVVDCCQPLEEVVADAYEVMLKSCRERSLSTARAARSCSAHAVDEPPRIPPMEQVPAAKPGTDADAGGNAPLGRLKVLVSAYACHPDRGAEANVAWNLVRELSGRHDLWVMTRKNNRQAIKASRENWVSRVKWVYLDPPHSLSFWRQGKRGVPPFYVMWQLLARRQAKRLMRNQGFDVCHHVTIGSYLVPSPLAGLGPPLVFGPVGGGERTPPGLADRFRWQGTWEEFLRDLVRGSLERFDVLHHWFQATAWTLAATPATEQALRQMGIDRISMMPQSATGGDAVEHFVRKNPEHKKEADATVRLITACRLVHWKAVDLAIEAVAAARAEGLDVRLTVLEEGPELEHLKRMVEDLNLRGMVTFTGRLATLDRVYERIREADGLIHPALHEAFGQACLESLALGVPVICLNWGGPGLIVDDTCGFRVEPGTREETVRRLATAIRDLHACKSSGTDFSQACVERSKAFQWKDMAERIEAIYQKVIR